MSGACAACGGAIDADAIRCSACGLAFLAPEKDDPLSPQGVPRHVEFYIGDAPRVVAAPAAGVEGVDYETPIPPAPPRAPVDPKVRRRRWIVAATIVAAVAAAVVALVRAHRPNDAYTRHELAFERFLGSDRLDPVDVPEAVDVDAEITEIGRAAPEALRAATAAHRPLPDAAGLSVHQFFDAFLERLLDVSPDYAFHLGIHPHPHGVSGADDTTRLRWIMLCRDASRALTTWPGAERLSPHDRADRDALLGWVDFQLRWRATRDIELLHQIESWFRPLVRLAEIPCCPVKDRIGAAVERLRALPAHLSAADRLDDADEYLSAYVDEWRDAPKESTDALRSAIEPARVAVRDCATRLRVRARESAGSELAIGRENVADVLRVYHRLPLDARTVYDAAADELRAAHDEMRRLASGPPTTDRPVCHGADDAQIDGLRRCATEWVPVMPPDDGVVVTPTPRLSIGDGSLASYLDPGALGPAAGGVVHVKKPRAGDGAHHAELEALRRRHMLAHESYPGHRMEALFRRKACALRAFVDDRVFVEGWGTYAEELMHETSECAGGSIDDWVRAERRATCAYTTMIELLIATGAATDDEVICLLHACGWPKATIEDVGEWQNSTLYQLNYRFGLEEIRRLRRDEETRLGAAFDLRAFHAKLLAEGPIPPRLIEEEWRAAAH